MSHIPKWPPDIDEWLPGDPTRGEPPLPRFSWNPSWLTTEQFTQLEEETSTWAARRAEAMVGPRAGFQTVRRAAHSMLESYISRLPPLPEVIAPAERKRRVRKPREEMAEELAPLVGVLTPEIEADLTAKVVTQLHEKRRPVNIQFQQTLAQSVRAWAEGKRVIVSEEEAVRIVKSAIEQWKMTLSPEVVVRDKTGKIIGWKTAEGIPVPPELWPTRA